jgi:peptide chain release factor 1
MVSNNNNNKAPDNLLGKLRELDTQYAEISNQLLDPEVLADHRRVRELAKKRAALEPIINDYRAYGAALEQLKELRAIVDHDADPQLVELAREELPALEARAGELLDAVQKRLITADDQAVGSIILEVRAGVGGDEAAIWAGDLLNMYRRFAAEKGWQVEDIQFSTGPAGPECGYKLAILRISGDAVWSQLGYEGGTHQVKRVPVTEAQGRVHTSTDDHDRPGTRRTERQQGGDRRTPDPPAHGPRGAHPGHQEPVAEP